jgi:hypothetical protein
MTPEDPEPRERKPGTGNREAKTRTNPARDSPATTIDTHSPPHRVYPGEVARPYGRSVRRPVVM